MKKFLAAMLSTTILCSAMAACGNQSTTPDTDDTAQSSSSSTSTNVKGTIAVVTKTMNNPFHVTYGEAIKQAGEAAGYEVLVSGPDAETDVDKQISLIETYIEQGVSAIVTSACSSTAIVDVIEQADAKGIPVFLVDSGADGGPHLSAQTTMQVVNSPVNGSAKMLIPENVLFWTVIPATMLPPSV